MGILVERHDLACSPSTWEARQKDWILGQPELHNKKKKEKKF